MKQNIKYLAIFLILIRFVSPAQGYNKVGTTAAQFLKIEAGARAVALGGAYAAIANDPYALYWNVAGIAQINKISANFTYENWIADLTHNFAGVVIPMNKWGNIGFSVLALNTDQIEETTIEHPRGTGTFVDAYDVAVGVSYARFMTEYVSVGITGKYVQQKLFELTAETVALDVGFLLYTGYKGVKVGLTLTNFGPGLKLSGKNLIRALDKWDECISDPEVPTLLETTSWPLPTSYRVSVAIDVLGNGSAMFSSEGPNKLFLAVDALHPSDNPEHYSVGLEYSYNQIVFCRAGYKHNTDIQGFTAGGGLRTPIGNNVAVVLDYAWADIGIFNYVQVFSLGFEF